MNACVLNFLAKLKLSRVQKFFHVIPCTRYELHGRLVGTGNNLSLYFFSFVQTPRKFIIAELSILLLVLLKIQAYGSKALQYKFTWCFQKAKQDSILYSPCKRTRNLIYMYINVEQTMMEVYNQSQFF